MSLYCFHIHAFIFGIILWCNILFLSVYILTFYFIFIQILFDITFSYLYHKREFDYGNNEVPSMKTNTSCTNRINILTSFDIHTGSCTLHSRFQKKSRGWKGVGLRDYFVARKFDNINYIIGY